VTKTTIIGGLPLVQASQMFGSRKVVLERCLIDTGSYSALVAADMIANARVIYEPNDRIRQIRGVGGTEFVFTKTVERIAVDEVLISNFLTEVGLMDYGFEHDAIRRMDSPMATSASIDLKNMQLGMA